MPDSGSCQAGTVTCGTACCATQADCDSYTTTGNTGSGTSGVSGTTKAYNPFCGGDGKSINTAIGCINAADPASIFESFFNIGIGMAGGIAFLLIIFGGFQMMTSAGNPEKMNAGKELVTSAVSGLLFIIFSVFILKLIGVKILNLPGFS